MFRLTKSTTGAATQPRYATAPDLSKVEFRRLEVPLAPAAPTAPSTIACRALLRLYFGLKDEPDKEFVVSVSTTVFNSKTPGEIYLATPGRQYERDGKTVWARDVLISPALQDVLCRHIHTKLEEASASVEAEEGEIPEDFQA